MIVKNTGVYCGPRACGCGDRKMPVKDETKKDRPPGRVYSKGVACGRKRSAASDLLNEKRKGCQRWPAQRGVTHGNASC